MFLCLKCGIDVDQSKGYVLKIFICKVGFFWLFRYKYYEKYFVLFVENIYQNIFNDN